MGDRTPEWAAFQTDDRSSYLCAEGGGGHEVVADRPALGTWETFRLKWLSQNTLGLRAFNGQYVCAEGGGGHEVVANRDALAEWETFVWRLVSLGGGGEETKQVALQAANGQYVGAEGGGGGEVNANRDEISSWETFWVVIPPENLPREGGWGIP